MNDLIFKQYHLFKTSRYFPLFATQFFGALNENIIKTTLLILITYQIAQNTEINTQTLLACAIGILMLPLFLFSTLAGQIADKYDKSKIFVFIKMAELILVTLVISEFYLQNLTLLFLSLFFLGLEITLLLPLKYSLLPTHLQEYELMAGNGLIVAGTCIAIVLGTLFGGFFIMSANGKQILSISLVIFAIIGLISSCFIPKTQVNHQVTFGRRFIKNIFSLIHYVVSHKLLFFCILGISWFWLLVVIIFIELPIYIKNSLHANEQVVTFILLLFTTGVAIGAMFCNRIYHNKIHVKYTFFSAIGMSIFLIDFYFAGQQQIAYTAKLLGLSDFLQTTLHYRICFDLLCFAICGGIYNVPLYTIMQNHSEKTHRARVLACNSIFNALFSLCAALISGILMWYSLSILQVLLLFAFLNLLFNSGICVFISQHR